MRWRRLAWGALVCLGLQAGAAGLPQQPQIDAAFQDMNAARWGEARQRLQALLTTDPPALARAQAHVLLAVSALRQGQHAAGIPHIRQALRLYQQPQGMPPKEVFLATTGALHTSTWLYAGVGLWPEAVDAAHKGLQHSLRWKGEGGGPGGAEALAFRAALLSHALRQQRLDDAQREVSALQRWLPADTACADDLCRSVQGHRLQLHRALGETEAAYALAASIQRNPAPIPPEAAAWNAVNAAQLAAQLDRHAEALQWFDAALASGAAADSPAVEGARMARIDLLARTDAGTPAMLAEAAIQVGAMAEQARLRYGVASPQRGHLLRVQANLLLRQGQTDASARLAAQALAIAWGAGDAELAWHAAQRLSHSAGDAGQMPAKVFYAKLGVDAAQNTRSSTLAMPLQRQQSHMAGKREDYVELADDLLDQRRLPEAEQLLAMVREEDYHQLVRSTEPRRQNIVFTGPELPLAQTLAERRQVLEHATADWTRQLRPLGAPEQPVQHALDATVAALLAAQELPATAMPLPQESILPEVVAGSSAVPHVYYLPTPERLRIAVVHAGRTEVVDVPVAEAALLRHIADLRAVLQNPARDARPQAQALYALLWAPIAHLLPPESGSRVVLHPEGALRYLPFGTLHDGTRWLVQRHALSLNAGAGRQREPAPAPRQGWALFGTSRASSGLPALSQVPGELASIRRAGPANTSQAMDAAFTVPRLQAALAQRSVVHIASHFVLTPGDSAASWLQLGGGERVSLAALAGDGFRFDGLDLLTLSACDTAVPPGVDAEGRSLDSLAWLAHERGAHNVLASLWPVPDGSTATLMQQFYQGLADGQNKPDALRAAQLALLEQPVGQRQAQVARGLQVHKGAAPGGPHPYYWGAFVLLAGMSTDAIK